MKITDGGLETCLIFDHGIELPDFAAFVLLRDEAGIQTLRRYFEPYLALARAHGTGFVVDTATWRANADWGERLGYSASDLDTVNRRAVDVAKEIRGTQEGVVIAGIVGPRGDGYSPAFLMDAAE